MAGGPTNLEGVLDELGAVAASRKRQVTVETIMDAVGRRSFGPLLLLAGLLGMTPVAAIPGAPSLIALMTLLTASQLLIGRKSLWLPSRLLRLRVDTSKVKKTVQVARKPARVVDRLVRPRLQRLTRPWADRVVALACVILALCVPPLELLPFVAFIPACAIAAFGLGLIARDGVVVLIAFTISGALLGLVGWRLLG